MTKESTLIAVQLDAFGRQVTFRVSVGDALQAPVDVLALKFAQAPYGVDRAALQKLGISEDSPKLPEPGETNVLNTHGKLLAPKLLIVGTPPLEFFDYATIRDLSHRAITGVQILGGVTHLGMTLHGVGVGLDETEAFIAQLAGFLDSFRRDEWPADLTTVTFYEVDERRAQRIGSVLKRSLPKTLGKRIARAARPGARPHKEDESSGIDSAGLGSRKKPHVFVAMQFGQDYDDLFHYGIQAAVQSAGFLCERIDAVAFTGDILAHIRTRIDTASFVVAELSAANPNVYLEVGYAWGRSIKTVLLARDAAQLRFDVQAQRCVLYSSIRDLEQKLTQELKNLAGAGAGS